MSDNPYDRPSDPAKRHSAALTDGADRAPARAMLKGTGFTDEDLARPLVGVATSWIETMPCNLNQRALAQHVKRGHPRRGRDADRVQHDRRLRRRLDGDRGHARVARLARGDRRLDRARRARAPVRRPRLPRRLRQDDPGGGDGAGAARPPRARALQRLDRARPLPGRRRHDPGRLRGGRRARRGDDERRGGARARERRLPGRGRVRRPVHGEHDVDGARLPRHLPGRPERDPGAAPVQGRGRLRGGRARDAARARRRPAVAHHHARGARQRGRVDRGQRRLDERRPAPARDRARARHPVHARGLRRGRGADARDREPQARRPLRRDRHARSRRRRARRARAAEAGRPRHAASAPNVDGRSLAEIAEAVEETPGPGGRRPARDAAEGDRRPARHLRQPRAGRRDREARRARAARPPRPGARLRLGGGLLRGGQGAHDPARATSS